MITRKVLYAVFPAVMLAGCGAKSFEYHPQTEIPEGPGMFSGKDGAVVLYSDEKKAEMTSGSGSTAASPEEYREFREYQEFQRLKESENNTSEYREFQEWREWKAYKKWKEGQQK